jgi:hypothetical protein
MDQIPTTRPIWAKILMAVYGLAILYVAYPPYFIFLYLMGIAGFLPHDIVYGSVDDPVTSTLVVVFVLSTSIGFLLLTLISIIVSMVPGEFTSFRKSLLLLPITIFIMALLVAFVLPSYHFQAFRLSS